MVHEFERHAASPARLLLYEQILDPAAKRPGDGRQGVQRTAADPGIPGTLYGFCGQPRSFGHLTNGHPLFSHKLTDFSYDHVFLLRANILAFSLDLLKANILAQ